MIQKKSLTFNFIFLISFTFFLKVFCIDFLFDLLKNTEPVFSFNFVQAWLIILCNNLFYFFCFIFLQVFTKSVYLLYKKNEFSPFISFRDFLINFSPVVLNGLCKLFLNQKFFSTFFLKLLIGFILFGFLLFLVNFKVTAMLWFGMQMILPVILNFLKRFKFVPSFFRIVVGICFSSLSWILLSGTFQENLLVVISGLVSLKSLFLYYNEYYIIWGVGIGFIVLSMLFFIYVIALSIPKLNNLLMYWSNKKRNLILGFFIFIGLISSFSSNLSKKSMFQEVLSIDKYPSLCKPFQRNKWLTDFVESSDSHTSFLVNLKDKTLISFQNKIDYYFYKRVTSRYIQDYSEMLNQDPTSDFMVVPYHSIFKLEKHATNLPIPDSTLELTMSKNEWESFQLIVIPNRKNTLEDVKIRVLSNRIKFEKIQLFQNEFVELLKPAYLPFHKGFIADPLIPMNILKNKKNDLVAKNKLPFKINSGECGAVWLNLKSSKTTISGKHTLSIIVSCRSSESNQWISKKIKIKLNILDFSLPEKFEVKTAFCNAPSWVANMNFYPNYKITDSLIMKYGMYANEYHLNPCDLYGSIENNIPIRLWPKFINEGANSICLGSIPFLHKDSLTQRRKFKKLFKSKIDSLKSFGIYNYAFLYGLDEIKIKNYLLFKEMVQLVREVDKNIPISSTTIQPNEKLEKMVDIIIPNLENYKIFKSKKVIPWTYVCANPKSKGIPNFFTDYCAISPRIIFWKANKFKMKGVLYYSTVFWINNSYYPNVHIDFRNISFTHNKYEKEHINGKRWPSIPWISYSYQRNNGDGQLFYPSTKSDELWPSIRLINIRDGIEDYEYAFQITKMNLKKICEELKKKRLKWLFEFNKFSGNLKSYENNPTKLLKIKVKAGLILEQYQKELKN